MAMGQRVDVIQSVSYLQNNWWQEQTSPTHLNILFRLPKDSVIQGLYHHNTERVPIPCKYKTVENSKNGNLIPSVNSFANTFQRTGSFHINFMPQGRRHLNTFAIITWTKLPSRV